MTVKASQPSRKELRLGVLGCGFMGKCHTNAYKKIPYIYPAAGVAPRLLMLCDKQEEKAAGRRRPGTAMRSIRPIGARWRRTRGSTWSTTAGPIPVHPDPCIAALAAGKHVICEKPMAVSVADARRMRDAAAAARSEIHVYVQLPLHARRAPGQGPDRRGEDRHDLPGAGTLPADGGARPGAAARTVLVFGLAAFRRPARDRQPRHRPVPLPRRRDRLGLGPGADLQPRKGHPLGRRPRRIGRRRDGRRAGVCRRGHRRDGVLRGGHGKKELSLLGDQRLAKARSAGTWSIPTACTPAWNSRAARSCWASARSPSPKATIPTSAPGGRTGTTWAGNTARSSRSSTSSMPSPMTGRSTRTRPPSRTATAWPWSSTP